MTRGVLRTLKMAKVSAGPHTPQQLGCTTPRAHKNRQLE